MIKGSSLFAYLTDGVHTVEKPGGKDGLRMRTRVAAWLCAALVALAGAALADEAARQAGVPDGIWIWIDVHQKSLTLYEGTRALKHYPIATGAWDTPTPIGIFAVSSRFAGQLGGFGTRFLGLNVPWGQFGIHGTNKPGSIGGNASHGCIRMFVEDSEELYGRVPNGAKVVIEGGPYGLLDRDLRMLRPGDRCSHVKAVQARLLQLGYSYHWPDGIYGQATQQAVMKARKALGLPAHDYVDGAFYRAIGLILFE